MRTLHYGIRLMLVLIVVALFYLSAVALFQQAIQLPVLLTLLFITFCTERLWKLLGWLSPVVGTVDTKEQERIIEYELVRSQRYNSPLVIAAMREKKHISLQILAQNLRTTDIVLRTSASHLLVLMPGIHLGQSSMAFKRITQVLPIKDIVVADEEMLQTLVATQSGNARNVSPSEIRKICIQALDAKSNSIKASENEADEAGIYNLIDLQTSQKGSDRKMTV